MNVKPIIGGAKFHNTVSDQLGIAFLYDIIAIHEETNVVAFRHVLIRTISLILNVERRRDSCVKQILNNTFAI